MRATYVRKPSSSGNTGRWERLPCDEAVLQVITQLMEPELIESGHGFTHLLRMRGGDLDFKKENLLSTPDRIVAQASTSSYRDIGKTKPPNDARAVAIHFMFIDVTDSLGQEVLDQLDEADGLYQARS